MTDRKGAVLLVSLFHFLQKVGRSVINMIVQFIHTMGDPLIQVCPNSSCVLSQHNYQQCSPKCPNLGNKLHCCPINIGYIKLIIQTTQILTFIQYAKDFEQLFKETISKSEREIPKDQICPSTPNTQLTGKQIRVMKIPGQLHASPIDSYLNGRILDSM